MIFSRKMTFLAFFLIIFTAFGAFAQLKELGLLQKNVADLSDTLAKSLPFNSSMGLNWSDAYVGKFLPSLPPHFGAGGVFGITTIDMPSLKGVAGLLGYDFPSNPLFSDKLIIPAWAAEARIGGFFLPFDIGVKFGTLPQIGWLGASYKLNYTLAGADLRWALLDGKTNLFLPNLSIGLGLNYLSGGIGASVGSDTELDVAGNTIKFYKPDINLLWDTLGLEAKLQISKQILAITPYIGIGAGYSWSKAGYELKTKVEYNGSDIDSLGKQDIKDYLALEGLEGISFSSNGLSSMVKNETWNVRAFGGISFNILILKLDVTAMYNILDRQLGATLGIRVQF